MARTVLHRTWAWLDRRSALLLLAVTALSLAGGGVAAVLDAILRLHTAQEDETYLSLGDTAEEPTLSAGVS